MKPRLILPGESNGGVLKANAIPNGSKPMLDALNQRQRENHLRDTIQKIEAERRMFLGIVIALAQKAGGRVELSDAEWHRGMDPSTRLIQAGIPGGVSYSVQMPEPIKPEADAAPPEAPAS